jgi:hypothetical protein
MLEFGISVAVIATMAWIFVIIYEMKHPTIFGKKQ